MHKLGAPGENGWDDDAIEHVHPAIYEVRQDRQRLYAGVPFGNPFIFQALTLSLQPPYILLYVLHTPRGEADPGRYQSPPLSEQEFKTFMQIYGPYLGSDGRFDVWARSHEDNATIVWDRHNFLFAYEPVDNFIRIMSALNFSQGDVPKLDNHVHHYRDECDADAAAILTALDWQWSPLRPEDEQ